LKISIWFWRWFIIILIKSEFQQIWLFENYLKFRFLHFLHALLDQIKKFLSQLEFGLNQQFTIEHHFDSKCWKYSNIFSSSSVIYAVLLNSSTRYWFSESLHCLGIQYHIYEMKSFPVFVRYWQTRNSNCQSSFSVNLFFATRIFTFKFIFMNQLHLYIYKLIWFIVFKNWTKSCVIQKIVHWNIKFSSEQKHFH
jgi:hypothetical protein